MNLAKKTFDLGDTVIPNAKAREHTVAYWLQHSPLGIGKICARFCAGVTSYSIMWNGWTCNFFAWELDLVHRNEKKV